MSQSQDTTESTAPASVSESLRWMLDNDANGCLTATVGSNGNGGTWAALTDDDDIASLVGNPAEWYSEDTDPEQLQDHLRQAGLDSDAYDPEHTTTWRRIPLDAQGYVTGPDDLIYTLLVA